ncbi:MAG: hypothetical protein EOO11_09465, partial [Chitinophagaceae bacterium]
MTRPQAPAAAYTSTLAAWQQQLARALATRRRLGWTRLLVFVAAAAAAIVVFGESGAWGLLPAGGGLALLLRLVVLDVNNGVRIRHLRILIALNEEELRCLDHRFHDRFDGAGFEPHEHPYAHDLDLFGPASLYQWIHRCGTEPGQARLAEDLLTALPGPVIEGRQQLVEELAPQLEWRQEFYARARRSTLRTDTGRRAVEWAATEEKHFTAPTWSLFSNAFAVVMTGAAVATFAGLLAAPVFSMIYGVALATSLLLSRQTMGPYRQLGGIVPEIETLRDLLRHIEARPSGNPLWNEWTRAAMSDGQSAAGAIHQLKAILDRFDLRLNIMGLLVLNPFLLWDVRQVIALNAWRRRHGAHVEQWFALVAEAEVWNTLATLRFNQPEWCLPR